MNRIERRDEVIQVEPRVMRVLVYLASRPNEVFSRETLFDLVWADTIVCEDALTRTISELRRIFADDPKHPQVIETIRKGGYRLIAPVQRLDVPAPAQPAPEPDFHQARRFTTALRNRWAIPCLVLLTLVSITWWGSHHFAKGHVEWEARPLTSFPGLEFFPALSPDGTKIALSWAGENPPEGEPLDIYVMKLSNGSPVRMTHLPLCEYFPTWSPDGSMIAFSNESEEGFEICTVDILDGTIRGVLKVNAPINGLDFSPSGETIVFSSADSPNGIPSLRLLSLDTLEQRTLTSPPSNCVGDIEPAFSPDGSSVAFIRINDLQEQDACIVPLDRGEVGKLEMGGERVSGLDWVTQSEMFVLATSGSGYGVWRVCTDSDDRIPFPIPHGPAQRASVAQNGHQLVYEQLSFHSDIWCLDMVPGGAPIPRSKPLIASTLKDSKPVFSPDGQRIAFVSDRSGSPEIWITDVDGSRPYQLTGHEPVQMMRPSWSPDGKRIAYSCKVDGTISTYVTDLSSKISRRVLHDRSHSLALWSSAQDVLTYHVDAPSGREIWFIDPDGTNPRRLRTGGYTVLGENGEGDALLCLHPEHPGIWRLPIDGSEVSLVVDGEVCANWEAIAPTDAGFYFLRREREVSTLGYYDLATARLDSLLALSLYANSPTLSPQGSLLLYDCIGEIESDLVLVEFTR